MFRRKPAPDGPVHAGDEVACRMCGATVPIDEAGRCPLGHRMLAHVEPAATVAPSADVPDAAGLLTEAFAPAPVTPEPGTGAAAAAETTAALDIEAFATGQSAAPRPAPPAPAVPANGDAGHPYDDYLQWDRAPQSAPAPAPAVAAPAPAHATTERLAIDEIVAFDLDAAVSALDVDVPPVAAPPEAPALEAQPAHEDPLEEPFDDDAADARRGARRRAATMLGGCAALLAVVASVAVLPL